MNGKTADGKKLIYICSPLKGDIAGNIAKARGYCKTVLAMGCIPIALHVMLDGILNDENPQERQTALDMGLELVTRCNELWIFTKVVSQGMQAEIDLARERHIPVKRVCFNFERHGATQQPAESGKKQAARSVETIIADMKRHIHEVGPEDVAYCLQDCTLCNEECRAWCGMSALEGELFRALAAAPQQPAESGTKGVVKINRDAPHLQRLDELGEDALKSPKLMDLVINGATLMSVNKDVLRGIIRVLLTGAAAQVTALQAEITGLKANSLIQENIIKGGSNPFDKEKIIRLTMENTEFKKALELAKSNMTYIATTRDICKVCRFGCKENRVHCSKFEWCETKQEKEAEQS